MLPSFDITITQKVSCQLREKKVYLGIQDMLYPSKVKLKRKKHKNQPSQYTPSTENNNQEPREHKRKEPPRIFTTEF